MQEISVKNVHIKYNIRARV